MHGQHRYVRPLLDGRGQADRREMRAVRGIHQQELAECAAQVGQRRQIAAHAVIGWRGYEDGPDIRMVNHLALDLVLRQPARHRERLNERRRNKIGRDIEQRAGMAHGFVAFAVYQHAAAPSNRGSEHGHDALRRSAGEEKTVGGTEVARSRDLRIADRAFPGVKVARTVCLGKVDGENLGIGVKQRLAFVAGHVETRRVARSEQLQRMEQRRAGERQQTVDLTVGQLCALGRIFAPQHG